ncbi:MAG: hypothetical protein V4579_01235 [Pseudomonadota bacterium]
MAEINAASNAVFCITNLHTYPDENDLRDVDEYELAFDVCELAYPEAEHFWKRCGWDLSGPDGRELDCADASNAKFSPPYAG